MRLGHIDKGEVFDFGKTSKGYGKFRDIYPDSLYQMLYRLGCGHEGTITLDLGTGTGVLPRHMHHYGGKFIGVDIAANQIKEAIKLSEGMNINYKVGSAEELDFPSNHFHVVTAVQCFWYFDQEKILSVIQRLMKPGGKFIIVSMAWLPKEDPIAKRTEEIIYKHNPNWQGNGWKRDQDTKEGYIAEILGSGKIIKYDEHIPFTAQSWNGRIKTCRGIGASLNEKEIKAFDKDHLSMLHKEAPESFSILHQIVIKVYQI